MIKMLVFALFAFCQVFASEKEHNPASLEGLDKNTFLLIVKELCPPNEHRTEEIEEIEEIEEERIKERKNVLRLREVCKALKKKIDDHGEDIKKIIDIDPNEKIEQHKEKVKQLKKQERKMQWDMRKEACYDCCTGCCTHLLECPKNTARMIKPCFSKKCLIITGVIIVGAGAITGTVLGIFYKLRNPHL